MKKVIGLIFFVLFSLTICFSQDKTVMTLSKPTIQLRLGNEGYYVKEGDKTYVLRQTQEESLWQLRKIYSFMTDIGLTKYDILTRADVVKMTNYFEIERIKKIIALKEK